MDIKSLQWLQGKCISLSSAAPAAKLFIREMSHAIASRIKLCLLLWLGFFKTMKLLLSVCRDLSVQCREIILVLNRVQSPDFR